jgi:5'-nucleotidase
MSRPRPPLAARAALPPFAGPTVAALTFAALTAGAAAAAEFRLTVLHLNDFHSRLEPINRFDSTCGPDDAAKGECFGGAARLKTAVDARRAAAEAEGRASLLLDAGDQFQGSLFYTTYKEKAVVEVMSALGVDAMALGNHEFDDGPATASALVAAAPFPVLAANVDVSAEPAFAAPLAPHAVLEAGGRRIGVIGALTTDTAEIASPGPNIAFEDEIAALSRSVAALEAEGANVIVALTHVGLARDLEIAAAVPGLDLIVGGHSHTLLSDTAEGAAGPYPIMAPAAGGGTVPVVHAYAYGKYLGEVTLAIDDAGRVTAADGEPMLLDASIAPDPAVAERIAAMAGPIEALRAEVIGEAAAPIDGARETCRTAECAMGVLVADAMLDYARPLGAEIAVQNGGGLRASIDAGPVTMGEVLTVLPFQNTVATFRITGAGLLAALENGLSRVEEGAGRFPQVAGMRYAWSPAAPAGARLVSAEAETAAGWAPIDPVRVYGVVTNNFLRKGGDGYAAFAEQATDAYDFGPGLDQVVVDHLRRRAPYVPRVDDRIVRRP